MDAAKTAKNLAQQAAKQIAREPFEVLKTARRQTLPLETAPAPSEEPPKEEPPQVPQEKVKERESRQLSALEKELEEISGLKVLEELQRRIAEGEEVPLGDYPELTAEQKEVLNAQMLAVAERKRQEGAKKSLVEPSTRPSRQLFGFGPGKTQAERQKTRVERPLPPSG